MNAVICFCALARKAAGARDTGAKTPVKMSLLIVLSRYNERNKQIAQGPYFALFLARAGAAAPTFVATGAPCFLPIAARYGARATSSCAAIDSWVNPTRNESSALSRSAVLGARLRYRW